MAIKDLLNEVIGQLPDGTDTQKEKLRLVISEFDRLDESSKQKGVDLLTYKNDLKKALTDLATKDSEIESLKKSQPDITELQAYKTRWEEHEAKQADKLKADWEEAAKIFSVDKTDKRFDKLEKLKTKFTFGDKDNPLTPEQIAVNINNYQLLKDAGTFDDVKPADFYVPRPTDNSNIQVTTKEQAAINLMKG